MTTSVSEKLMTAIAELRSLFPAWRIGQLVANLTQAVGKDREGAIWEVDDEELLMAARRLIARNLPHRVTPSEQNAAATRVSGAGLPGR
jgi:hypothetical protein